MAYQLVLSHDLHVNVVELALGRSESAPDLCSMKQIGMTNESGNGREAHSVGKRKGGRKEQG